ncbi:hypothetical protein LJR009_000318 [Bosea sp. LjRoot9]|uniref:hypothetical protein n=1 Tax=Bosea sp. LjRoot9 TaxID=3342341 RepID=UPI003ED1659F
MGKNSNKTTVSLKALSLTVCSLLTGCASAGLNYDDLPAGRFTGSLVVIWVGEGDSSGDGRFLYVPDPRDPLTFIRRDTGVPGAAVRPGVMYTDGGSIPKLAQAFRGFSPWGYAPAYMIHDWLFVAQHCVRDGHTDPKYQKLKDVTFPDSAKIIGEAIRALVASRRVGRDDTAASLITTAVGTEFARQLWNEDGACARSLVDAKDLALAERIVPGSTGVRFDRAQPNVAVGNARILTRISF